MTTLALFTQKLATELRKGAPGHSGFFQASGIKPLQTSRLYESTANKSAVLLALYPTANGPTMSLILRPPYNGTHGGQVSFPGGRMEDFDESFAHTALREAEEEVGIKALDVEIFGELTPVYIQPSNFWVQPILGHLSYHPHFHPDAREVAQVLEIPLNSLNHANYYKRIIEVRDTPIASFGFMLSEHWVWGATALIIWELIEIMKNLK